LNTEIVCGKIVRKKYIIKGGIAQLKYKPTNS
jgi:hypothetical protein